MTNPPSDIMWSDFFEPLDWQQIYSRSIPGPISNIERPTDINLERPSMATPSMADINTRDSIISPSRDLKNKDTSIPDWSFMDSSVLSTVTPPTNTNTESNNKK